MKLLRSSPFVFTSLLALACSEDRGALNPSSGNVAASSTSTGGEGGSGGGDGGAPGTGGTGVTSTGGGDAVTSTGGSGQGTTTTSGTGGTGGGTGGQGGTGGGTGGTGGGEGGSGLPFHCINDEVDVGETDVDCGGDECPPCEEGLACEGAEDCIDSICTDLLCVLGTCGDFVVNQDETDEDCGGLTCAPCEFGEVCLEGTDCLEGVCTGGFCAMPGCSDDVQNGDETGLDCGGGCDPCPALQGCVEAEDCQSGVCTLQICQAPTCGDGVENGGETDIDCGGNGCEDCGAGKSCSVDANCLSGDCGIGGVCLCPSGMTTVPIPGGGSYCIDPAEVTYSEYNAFVTANPPFNVDVCEFNIGGYTPTLLWPPDTNTPAAANYIRRPVRHVDWCDAAAYCTWRGKRLCGAIEGGPSTDLDDATQDQWFNACTAGGTNTYPYSGVFNTTQCTESVDEAAGAPASVRDAAGTLVIACEGGYSTVYQMSGNVAEWVDSCTAAGGEGDTDDCVVRGGSYLSTDPTDLTCAATEIFDRSFKSADIGIRCCQ